jgi:hypothetical protein
MFFKNPRLWPTSVYLGWLLLIATQVGCGAKKPIFRDATPFRLESLNNDSLLFTPLISGRHPVDDTITVTATSSAQSSAEIGNCSAEQGPFRLQLTDEPNGGIRLTLPSPARWLRDLEGRSEAGEADDVESLNLFLAKLDQLRADGCPSVQGASIHDFVLQSLPMRPNEGLFNAYGYRKEHSSVALKPGVRLKIERAYFRPAAAGEDEHDPKNFIGISRLLFDVEGSGEGRGRFVPAGEVEYSPPSIASDAKEGSVDQGLVNAPLEQYDRLLFYTFQVRKEHIISAAIIGASDPAKLNQLEQVLRARSDQPCKDFAAQAGIACFEFDGFVTVSAKVRVEVNGKTVFLDWGADIRDVLPKNSTVKAIKSLRIQRQYMGEYHDVRFDWRDPNVLTLELVGGDRVSW